MATACAWSFTPAWTGDRQAFVPPGDREGTDKAARHKANGMMTRLLAEVDEQQTTDSGVTLGYVIEEWLLHLRQRKASSAIVAQRSPELGQV